jgi:hypothetical protein
MPQIIKKSAPAAKGEMGKPSLKGKFEAAMQKQFKSRPENAAKATSAPKGVMKKATKY